MECGDCTLCCELFPVNWLNKPGNIECIHANKGCNIHTTKPEECSNFNCLYILDEMEPEMRPDKVDVVFEGVTTKITLGTYKTEKVWENPVVKTYIEDLNKKGISVIFSSFYNEDETRVFLTEGHTIDGVLRVARNEEKKRR